MTFDERLNAFIKLGEELRNISESQMGRMVLQSDKFLITGLPVKV